VGVCVWVCVCGCVWVCVGVCVCGCVCVSQTHPPPSRRPPPFIFGSSLRSQWGSAGRGIPVLALPLCGRDPRTGRGVHHMLCNLHFSTMFFYFAYFCSPPMESFSGVGVFLCGKLSRSRWCTSLGEVVTATFCQESPSDQICPVTTSLGGWCSRYVMPPPEVVMRWGGLLSRFRIRSKSSPPRSCQRPVPDTDR